MLNETEAICELWEAEAPVHPPHSRLYHLKPIGVGSPLGESLTSYVMRLAEAHSVPPRVLVSQEVLPLLNRPYLDQKGQRAHGKLSSFWLQSAVLNGVTPLAEDFVRLLERLTARDDLHLLTMLLWKEELSYISLLRRTRAWCSFCYEEWRESGQVIYDPLLWMLSVVSVCPKHDQPLVQHCPNPACARVLYPLHPRGHPGYCPWCNRWLGGFPSKSDLSLAIPTDEERAWQHWVVDGVSELLAATPSLTVEVLRDKFAAMISSYVNNIAEGKLSTFANLLQVSLTAVWQWQHRQGIPQLATLLKICARLGISPLRLLTGDVEEFAVAQRSASEVNEPTGRSKKRLTRRRKKQLQDALERVLRSDEDPPPSMKEVGRRLRYDSVYLSKLFPDLCQAISKRYMNYRSQQRADRIQRQCKEVWQAIHGLLAQGYYPTRRRVSKLLSPGIFLQPEMRAFWKEAIQQLRENSELSSILF